MTGELARRVVGALGARQDGALSAGELGVELDAQPAALNAALDDLERDGRIVVLVNAPPDIHLQGVDLRTVGLVREPSAAAIGDARAAAQGRWDEFVRAFLASHRCS